MKTTMKHLALAAMLIGGTQAQAQTELITNGGFETGDLSGWQSIVEGFSEDAAFTLVYSDPTSTGGSFWPLPPPVEGRFAVYTDMTNPAYHVLYQDIAIPEGASAELSLSLYYANFALEVVDGPPEPVGSCPTGEGIPEDDPPTPPPNGAAFFSNGTTLIPGVPPDEGQTPTDTNQRVRVDIADPAMAPEALGAAVYEVVFETQPGDDSVSGYSTITADLSAYAGQTIRLRIIDSYFWCFLHIAVDNVSVQATGGIAPPPAPPPAPAIPVPVDQPWALLALLVLMLGAGALPLRSRD